MLDNIYNDLKKYQRILFENFTSDCFHAHGLNKQLDEQCEFQGISPDKRSCFLIGS